MTPLPPLAVLAGGLATRLGDLTRATPKSLLKVAGKPFLAHQLRLFRRQGFPRAVLLAGHLAEALEAFVASRDWELPVQVVRDGPRALGTGGAVRAALPALGAEFAVTYGDSWLDADPAPACAAFREAGLPALMVVLRNAGRWGRSNAAFDGARVTVHDKRAHGLEWIDWGLTFFRADAFHGHAEGSTLDLAEVTGALAARGLLGGFETRTRFHEIGSREGLAETDALLRGGRAPSGGS